MPYTRRSLYVVLGITFLASGLVVNNSALATPDGIQGFSGASGSTCTLCHGGGTAPTVTLQADSGSTTVLPGSTSSYTFTMSGGPASAGGLDIAASNGTLIDTNTSGTRISGGELIHNSPLPISGGSINWAFEWQAPTNPGTYTIYAAGLSANGNGGTSGDGTGATSIQITVASATNQSPMAIINAPTSGMDNTPITFDASGSSDPDGTISTYAWDFGDGSNGMGAQVTHAFAAGTYTVALTVTDNMGATDSTSMEIQIAATNIPPVASISGPGTGTEGVPVTFDGTGSTDSDGSIVGYDWDFGDNSSGSGVTVTHTFAAGTYTVTLMVTDNDGAFNHATMDITIAAPTAPQPPIADAGGPYSATVGEAVQFDASGSMDTDGNIASYSWDFGDGNTGTGVGPVHTYNAPGNYTVKVTVVDNDGLEGTGQTTADITEVTQPPPDGIAEAEALYNTYCAGCHGVKGTDGFDPEVQGEDAEDIAEAIDEEPAMAFLADVLTSADIDAIANYLDEDGAPGDKDDDMDDHGDHDDDMDDHGDHDGDAHDNDDRDEDGDRHGRGNGNHDRQNANPFATATDATSTGGGGVHWATVLLAFFAVARRRWYMK